MSKTNATQLLEYTKIFDEMLTYGEKCSSCENLLGKRQYLPIKTYAAGASASMIAVLSVNSAPVVLKIYFIGNDKKLDDPTTSANIEIEILQKARKLVLPDETNNFERATQNIIMAYTFGCCNELFDNSFIFNSCMRGYLRPYVAGEPVDKEKENAIISHEKVLYCGGQTGKEIRTFKNKYHNVAKLVTMEYVDSGTLGGYIIQNFDDEEIKSYVFQLFLTIMMMYDQFGFVHQDLHLDNILLKKCIQYDENKQKKQYYRYIINGRSFYVPAFKMIPKLMDFDDSVYNGIPGNALIKKVPKYNHYLDHYTLLYHIYVSQKRQKGNGVVVQWIESIFPKDLLNKAEEFINLPDEKFNENSSLSKNHVQVYNYLKDNLDNDLKLPTITDLILSDFYSEYENKPANIWNKFTGKKIQIIETFKYQSSNK